MPLAAGLYHELHGDPAAPPLLLSSGLGGSADYWRPNLAALAERYRVILYDHRGTGRSGPAAGPITIGAMADDVLALLDALGIGRTHLIGHAAGAIIGLALALKMPDRLGRLVAVNGWSSPDPHFVRCFDTRLALLRASGARAYVHAQPIFLYPANWISEQSDRLAAEEETQLAHLPAASMIERRIQALRAFDIAARLGEIGTGVLALAAADDMLVPSRCSARLAQAIPGARLATIAWGGHACNVTDAAGFNALVLDFLGS